MILRVLAAGSLKSGSHDQPQSCHKKSAEITCGCLGMLAVPGMLLRKSHRSHFVLQVDDQQQPNDGEFNINLLNLCP